jgi:hypothetical protein
MSVSNATVNFSLGLFAIIWAGSLCLAQQECSIPDWLPIGLENQYGYTFNYQSGKGKECRAYRLRNKPGQVSTAVDWRDTRQNVDELLLNVTLAECTKGTECPWMEQNRVSVQSKASLQTAEIGETKIGFGVPTDEYEDKVGAYRQKVEKQARFTSFTTVLRGIVGGRENKQHEIAIRVTSSMLGTKPFLRLTYRVELAGESEPLATMAKGGKGAELSFDWQAAATPAFKEKLMQQGQVTRLSSDSSSLEVELPASEVVLDRSDTLVIFEGETAIAATSAPAYRPKGNLKPLSFMQRLWLWIRSPFER